MHLCVRVPGWLQYNAVCLVVVVVRRRGETADICITAVTPLCHHCVAAALRQRGGGREFNFTKGLKV